MDYSNESWIKVYTRDTAEWRATSLAARGLALELSRNMGRFSDEIALGTHGLRAVAALVTAPWNEVEPLLEELLKHRQLEYDPEREVLRDPRHLARQQSATSPAQRKRDSRRGNVTDGHTPSRVVTPRHDQREETDRSEERETPAPEGDADALEEPDGGLPVSPRNNCAPKRDMEPDWLEPTLAGAEVKHGLTFDRTVVWEKYAASRERDRRTPSAADFRSFLASWAGKQKSEPQRDGPRLSVVKAEPPPKPYEYDPERTAEKNRERRADRRTADSPEGRAAAVETAAKLAAGNFG